MRNWNDSQSVAITDPCFKPLQNAYFLLVNQNNHIGSRVVKLRIYEGLLKRWREATGEFRDDVFHSNGVVEFQDHFLLVYQLSQNAYEAHFHFNRQLCFTLGLFTREQLYNIRRDTYNAIDLFNCL